MSSPSFERVAGLFEHASRLDETRRLQFLEEACGGDESLKAEVISLLRHDEERHPVLSTGGMAGAIVDAVVPPPERLGHYRILGTLGEGGMGIVFRAEQEAPIRRMVAIKLVKGFLARAEAAARLEVERQALAMMNHPNIAHVYDAGATPEGRPYFVMELVAGEPITSFCDHHGLDVRERLVLLIQVCDGVQHAHRNAIIHRDLKPSNVLVSLIDGKAVPKIIDFGVAKALDQRLDFPGPHTQTGQFLGTPEYASPEQSNPLTMNVDTRTDVYSLGVLLYELLAGRPPLQAGDRGIEDLLRRIREETPLRPSSAAGRAMARRLRGDLDWITMKALEKEPDRRYDTPADLAEDISKHLRQEPIAAGPPSAMYRLGRMVRRHKVASVLSLALSSSLVAFTIVLAIQAARISREADRANREAAAAEELVNFSLGLFGAPIRSTAAYTVRSAPFEEILTPEKIRAGLPDRPLLRARLLHALGENYRRNRRAPKENLPVLEEARDSLVSLAGPDDPLTIDAVQSLGTYYLGFRQFADAEPLLLQVFEARSRSSGPDHPDTLAAKVLLGYLYKMWDRNEEAARWLEEGIAGLSRVLGDDRPETLIARGYYADVLLRQRRFAEAEALLKDLVNRMPGVVGQRHTETAIAIYNLGVAYANLGQNSKALEHLNAALERGFAPPGGPRQDPLLDALRNDPDLDSFDRSARTLNLSEWERRLPQIELYIEEDRNEEAEKALIEMLDAVRRLEGSDGYHNLEPMLLLADLRLRQGRIDEAESLLLTRITIARKLPDVYNQIIGGSLLCLVQCDLGRGDRAKALARLHEALEADVPRSYQGRGVAYARAMEAGIKGDRKAALDSLNLAADRGYADARRLSMDLSFQSLHGDPAFEKIRERVAGQASRNRPWSLSRSQRHPSD